MPLRQVFKQWRQRARRENREVKAGEVPFFYSLQGKYVATYLLLVVAIVLVLNTYPLIMAQNMVFSAKEASLKRQALAIGSALAVSEVLTEDGVAQAMELLDDMQGTRVLVTNESGLILYDSSTLEKRTGDYAITAEVVKALRGEDVCRSEYRQGAFRTRVAVPTVYRGVTLGAVYLYEYDTEQAEVLLSIQSTLRYISVVICVVALVAALILSKALTRNTSRLLGGIRSVREGEYNHRIEVKGKDEMAQLAMEFNELTDRLQTIEEVRRRFVSDASHELKTPLASIRLLADSILQNSSVDMETVREFVSDIGEEADRLTRISQRLLALSRLDENLHHAVFGDGSQWEQSPMYHCEVLHNALDVVLVGRKAGVPLPAPFTDAVHRMCRALAAWVKPDGRLPMQSDSDDMDARDLLAAGALLFEDGATMRDRNGQIGGHRA